VAADADFGPGRCLFHVVTEVVAELVGTYFFD
jgi:hypothetical protein